MAFVYEKISDEDRRKIDFSKIKIAGNLADSSFWSVDKEQDNFLVWGYPEREPPYFIWFAYVTKGKTFEVAVLEKGRVKNPQGKWILRREIEVFLPYGLSAHSPEVDIAIGNIKESLKVYVYGVQTKLGRQNEIAEIQIEKIKQE